MWSWGGGIIGLCAFVGDECFFSPFCFFPSPLLSERSIFSPCFSSIVICLIGFSIPKSACSFPRLDCSPPSFHPTLTFVQRRQLTSFSREKQKGREDKSVRLLIFGSRKWERHRSDSGRDIGHIYIFKVSPPFPSFSFL